MITNVLIAHTWLSTLLLALLVLGGPLVGAVVARRPVVAWTLAALAAVPVVLLTMWPSGSVVGDVRCEVAFSVPTLARVELAANVALFVAPALFATVASRRPLVALALTCGGSVVIEVVQALVPALGRACSTNDWSSNSIGAAAGVLLGLLALRLAATRPPGRRTRPRTAAGRSSTGRSTGAR